MEAIDDIVREMRCGMIPKRRHDRELLLNFSDRIEAAVKVLEADRDNCRRQALNEDARANATCEKSSHVGNEAKMREALSVARELLLPQCNGGTSFSIACAVALVKIDSALAEPIRNCDAFSKAEVLEVLEDRSFSKEDTIEWLFAEAKGKVK